MKRLALALAILMAIALLALAYASGARRASTSALTVTKRPSAVQAATETLVPKAEPSTAAGKDRAGLSAPTIFAVIGDNGTHNEAEKKVAELVKGWQPEFIVDLGDAYYASAGGSTTDKYDLSEGAYFCAFLKNVTTTGTACPGGEADRNRFFPTLGNHDYSAAGLDLYLAYFDLPGAGFTNTSGNERYYDFTWGPIHFFSLNSNSKEPDGVTSDSKQARWLKAALATSKSPWNIVFFHHPPYTSGITHGPDTTMRWPFKEWGAQVVLNGHEHLYERILHDGVVYFVNGLGGNSRYDFGQPIEGSVARVNDDWGAQKVTATDKKITFEFYTVDGKLRDAFMLEK